MHECFVYAILLLFAIFCLCTFVFVCFFVYLCAFKNTCLTTERKETIFSITSLEAIISGFNVGNFPIQMLLSDRSKFSNSRTSFTYHRGLYHDVLFLIISVYGADSVNLGKNR